MASNRLAGGPNRREKPYCSSRSCPSSKEKGRSSFSSSFGLRGVTLSLSRHPGATGFIWKILLTVVTLTASGSRVFGFFRVYNLFPAEVVEDYFPVLTFQGKLQDIVFSRAVSGCDDWGGSFSCLIPSLKHLLR